MKTLAALLLLGWGLSSLQAQEATETTIEARFEAAWSQMDPKNNILIAVGNVQLEWKGGQLRCDNAVIWGIEDESKTDATGATKPGGIRVAEIYAEGEVHLRHDENWFHLEGARGFVDPVNNRGIFFDSTMSVQVPGRDGMIKVTTRAGEAIRLAENRFEMRDMILTTSPFAEPGYHISSARLRLQLDPPLPDPNGKPGATTTNVRYDIDGSVLALEGRNLVPLPGLSGNTADDTLSFIKRVGFDSSKRFGPSAYVSVGAGIHFDDERWGDWTLHTRYLGDRGPGVGLDLEYERPGYRGRFQGYYQNDDGRDEFFGAPPHNDRGRALLRHRQHDIGAGIQLDVEFSKITDRGYLPEYEEDEFKSDKEQETLIYFSRRNENRAATLLLSTRLNEFQTQVERQPQFGYNLISEPLFDLGPATLYFDADYEVSRSRIRYDDALNINDRDAFRADFDNVLAAPIFAGPVKIEPFAGFRYTYYSNGAIGSQSLNRVGMLYGVRATTELSRTFNASGGFFNLEGLRHIIMPEVEYLKVGRVSHSVQDFIQFDRVDRFSELEVIRFGVRNRLQTLWDVYGKDEVVDIVDLDIEWSFYPEAKRDNFGTQAGNLDLDLLVRLSPEFTYLLDFEYSFHLDTMEVLNTTLGWAPSPDFQIALGYRRYVDVNDVVLVQTQWRPTERIGLRLDVGFDFEESELQDTRLTLVRYGADWVFEVEFDWDNTNDFGVGISFSPRALFDPRLRARSLRNEPRFADFDDRLVR